jgi:hypothetical protein
MPNSAGRVSVSQGRVGRMSSAVTWLGSAGRDGLVAAWVGCAGWEGCAGRVVLAAAVVAGSDDLPLG